MSLDMIYINLLCKNKLTKIQNNTRPISFRSRKKILVELKQRVGDFNIQVDRINFSTSHTDKMLPAPLDKPSANYLYNILYAPHRKLLSQTLINALLTKVTGSQYVNLPYED